MPSFTQLEYILSVYRLRHFGRAAKECHVSQPSLSIQIQKVEEILDFIIFDRSKKPIEVTDRGLLFIKQAQVIIREHERLLEIASKSQKLAGKFNLGVIPTLSPYIIPLFIESFSQNYPEVKLNINEYKTEDIVAKLYDDELDGGILVTPLYDEKIIERSLFYEPFHIFISDQHQLINKKHFTNKDLIDQQIWLLSEGHCFRDQMISVCSRKESHRVLKNIDFESGNLETLKNLIRRGNGLTLLPELATHNLSSKEKSKNLKPFKGKVPIREVSIVYSRSFLKEEIIDALELEILKGIPENLESFKKNKGLIIDPLPIIS